jgi:uncharacterized membrane protein
LCVVLLALPNLWLSACHSLLDHGYFAVHVEELDIPAREIIATGGNMRETASMAYLLAFLIGIVAGLRSMTAPAAVSWASYLGRLHLGGTGLAFLGHRWTPWILTLLALGELVADQLPSTPSRTAPLGFGGRIVTGALSGAAVGTAGGTLLGGAIAGVVGAVVGTLGGHSFRARLATALGNDRPAALIEDTIAIAAALAIMMAL